MKVLEMTSYKAKHIKEKAGRNQTLPITITIVNSPCVFCCVAIFLSILILVSFEPSTLNRQPFWGGNVGQCMIDV